MAESSRCSPDELPTQMSALFHPPDSTMQLAASHGGGENHDLVEELRQAKREIQLLKSMDPFRAADMALEIQMEKMRVAEAASARDSAVQRLASAYDSIKQKVIAIGRLQSEKEELERRLVDSQYERQEAVSAARAEERRMLEAEISRLTAVISKLTTEMVASKGGNQTESAPTATSESGYRSFASSPVAENESAAEKVLQSICNDIDHLAIESSFRPVLRESSLNVPSVPSGCPTPALKLTNYSPVNYTAHDRDFRLIPTLREPEEMTKARYAILASLPLPTGVPSDVLKPITIPPPFTLHEFLGNTTGSLKSSLLGYRAFQDMTTVWCPEREEHGYFLTPLYKCNTNPRITTAHRWNEVDPRGRMTQPTECFYSKDAKWYYAGQYVALRLEDLTPKEWEALEAETASTLVKETLAGRKNTSPQNHYETAQLYAAGALKIACVGLQCVGFNINLYRTIIDQASKCQQSGRWRMGWGDSDCGSENSENFNPAVASVNT